MLMPRHRLKTGQRPKPINAYRLRQKRGPKQSQEHKRRKRDVLADEHAQFEFFDARIPAEVNSAATFKKWLLGLGDEGRELLYLGHV